MKQKIILFDIDYTLFDVGYFDKHFHKKLSEMLLIDEDLIKKLSVDIIVELIGREHFLDINKYLKTLLPKLEKEKYKPQIENLLFKTPFFRNGFYSEVESVLKTLKKIARLGIFSQGDERFQGAKIQHSGFKDLFEKELIYIIKPRKLDHLPFLKNKHQNEKLFLVDDKPNIICEVKKQMSSIFTVWIKRGKYAEAQKDILGFSPDATITNLREMVKIVKA